MKYIQKGKSPQLFEDYKKTNDASFSDLDNHSNIKRGLKNSLIAEQGGICCYCGKRIDRFSSTIEHFKPKSCFPELQLEYSNLLASCRGGSPERGEKRKYGGRLFPLSCDASKGNRIIAICPTDPGCENYFAYDDDGAIYGIDADAVKTIEILHLNNEYLKNQRKGAIDAYRGLPDDTDWENEIRELSKPDKEGLYEPYCFAAIYYIKKFRMYVVAA